MPRPTPCCMVVALTLAACGGAADSEPPPPAEVPAVATSPAPLRVELHAPVAAGGRPVPLELVVRNAGRAPAALETGDSATTFDLVVATAGGHVVWNRLHAVEEIPLALIERTVPPGDALRFADRWDLRDNAGRPVPPGTYSVYGLLDTNETAHLRTPARSLVVGAAEP